MSTQAERLAEAALQLAKTIPPIPYVLGGKSLKGMDCQGLITYCAASVGAKTGWSDSNALARMYLAGALTPIKDAKGDLRGWVGLLIEPVGVETPARYKDDMFAKWFGDCTHVGIICQAGNVWSVDASKSAGKVRTRTEREARACWTHAAMLKGVEYEGAVEGETAVADEGEAAADVSKPPPHAWFYATVNTPNMGPLNLRRAPTMMVDNRVGRANCGDRAAVLERRSDGWSKVSYQGIEAYALTIYLKTEEAGG